MVDIVAVKVEVDNSDAENGMYSAMFLHNSMKKFSFPIFYFI